MSRRAWGLALPLGTCAAIAVAATVVTLPRGASATASSAWLPPDGHVVRTGDGVESWAVLAGGQLLPTAPLVVWAGFDEVSEAIGLPWLRRTAGTASGQVSQYVAATDDGLELVAVSGPGAGWGFSPRVALLPVSTEPGSRWAGEGSVVTADGGGGSYAFTASAAAAEGNCLRLEWSLTLTVDGQAHELPADETWCPGEGVVASGEPPLGEPGADPAPAGWPDPAAWRAQRVLVTSAGGGAATLTTVGPPLGPRTLLTGNSRDAVRLDGNDRVSALLHPGGQVLVGLEAAGWTIVGTDRRELVAFDAHGSEVWRTGVGEVPRSMLRLPGELVAVVDADGTLTAHRLADGAQQWRADLGLAGEAEPVVSGDRILLAARDGRVVSVAASTGRVLWETSVVETPQSLAFAGGVAVVLSGLGDVEAFDEEGRALWRRRFGVGLHAGALISLGPDVVVASGVELARIDAAGVVLWRRAAVARDVVGDAGSGQLATIADEAVVVWRGDGTEAARFELDPAVDLSPQCAPVADGVACTSVGAAPLLRFSP